MLMASRGGGRNRIRDVQVQDGRQSGSYDSFGANFRLARDTPAIVKKVNRVSNFAQPDSWGVGELTCQLSAACRSCSRVSCFYFCLIRSYKHLLGVAQHQTSTTN